jgi:Domain of unknown function (DUF3786)
LGEDAYKTGDGEARAWEMLAACDPAEVAANSLASYDYKTGRYTVEILGETYEADPAAATLINISNPARPPEYLLRLATPAYLANARPVPPSGELVKELSDGFFFRGAHTLPLDIIAERYGDNPDGFAKACIEELGGESAGAGDRGCRFSVYPRVSMTFVLWLGDDEFASRAYLLFDSNAGLHMALDLVWAVALVACQRLLNFKP